jgi:Na+(H+)/acetate symporter ActP
MWYTINTREDVRKLAQSLSKTAAHAREQLAANAVSDEWKHNRTEELMLVLFEIAEAEAKAVILDTAATWLESATSASGQDVYNQLVKDFMSSGADDTWSGRRNDLRRVAREAKREALVDLEYGLTKLA